MSNVKTLFILFYLLKINKLLVKLFCLTFIREENWNHYKNTSFVSIFCFSFIWFGERNILVMKAFPIYKYNVSYTKNIYSFYHYKI